MLVRNNFRKIPGFTIVELLVIIVIIGILASITLISFRGISQKAVAASVINDLDSALKKFKLHQIENSGYPTTIDCSLPTSAVNICLKPSPNNQYTLMTDNSISNNQTFCLTIKNTANNIRYYIDNSNSPKLGGCPIPAPANFAIASKTSNSINLSWTAVTGATSYTLQKDISPAFPNPVQITTTLATTATSAGLTASTTYYYRIMATTPDDTTVWSPTLASMYATNFAYTGGNQTWTVPAGVTSIVVESWGASGGNGGNGGSGGNGGYAKGTMIVTPGQVITISVGGRGADGGTWDEGNGCALGGYDGGSGGSTTITSVSITYEVGGGGDGGQGGYTDYECTPSACYYGGGNGAAGSGWLHASLTTRTTTSGALNGNGKATISI